MTEDNEDKATRLLDIIEEVISRNANYFETRLPYQINRNGDVHFDDLIIAELIKPQNSDLTDWAPKNVVSLFQ